MNKTLSYFAQAAIARHHWLSGWNNKEIFFYSFGGWKFEVRKLTWLGYSNSFLSSLQMTAFLCSCMVKRELSISSFSYRAINPIGLESSSFDCNFNHLLKAVSPIQSLRVMDPKHYFGRGQGYNTVHTIYLPPVMKSYSKIPF